MVDGRRGVISLLRCNRAESAQRLPDGEAKACTDPRPPCNCPTGDAAAGRPSPRPGGYLADRGEDISHLSAEVPMARPGTVKVRTTSRKRQ